MNTSQTYSALNPREVARALDLSARKYSHDRLKGVDIAQAMLTGIVEFTQSELEKLAAFKGIAVEELIELDESFKQYRDLATETKKAIASKMLDKGFDFETAAELCGLPIGTVQRLKG